jgi:hypothetical protein
MIPVAMGENDPLDCPKVDPESGDVTLEDILLWPCVEEESVPAFTTIGSDETRQTVGRTADTAA